MTTRADMPTALTAADERFLSELARQLVHAASAAAPRRVSSPGSVMNLPGSGTPDKLMEAAGISASEPLPPPANC